MKVKKMGETRHLVAHSSLQSFQTLMVAELPCPRRLLCAAFQASSRVY